jgi:polysaccharide biosynthesis protein PslF
VIVDDGSPVGPRTEENMMKIPDISIGFVSTYPPTVCGLATYTESLLGGIAEARRTRAGLGVVTVGDEPRAADHPDVVHRHRTGSTRSRARAVRVLNDYDTVSIQHEFGIFGGRDGREVIDLLEAITVPTAVTLHTVLEEPTAHQRAIVERIALRANRLVVMSETAASCLRRRYDLDPGRIEVIPHGANALFSGPSLATGTRPLALTWGLIGPGKGLESVISAFAQLTDLDPAPRYLIAGATHPKVRESAGESYRESLVALVRDLGLEHMVEFDDRYFDRATLARLVRSSDLVVLPYASTQQVTSGVLTEAIAAAKPVIATRFPHALELLGQGAGLTVPHGDTDALASALRHVFTDHAARERMAGVARRLADGWFWPTIGNRFADLMSRAAGRQPQITQMASIGALARTGLVGAGSGTMTEAGDAPR